MMPESDRLGEHFRPLTDDEITLMRSRGCHCDDWSNVRVAERFNAEAVRTTHFSGDVTLGVFEKQVSFFGGFIKPAGISDATIHNCIIGDNVYISRVKNYIANYNIEADAVIDNIDLLAVEAKAALAMGRKFLL